jgi:hypothetical protein
MSADRIRRAIDDKSVAKIAKIDIIARVNDKGEKYNRVYVHFDHWFNTDYARCFRDDLLAGKEMTIVYDNPWFWKVTASKWKADPNYHSNVKLGEREDKDNETKNETASHEFLSKLFNPSKEDIRPYRERRIDPAYVAQDVAQGFLERRPRPAHIFIATDVERGIIGKSDRKRDGRRADVEDKRRHERRREEEDRRYQDDLYYQRYLDIHGARREEEDRRYQDDLYYEMYLDIQQAIYDRHQEEKQEQVNREYQEEQARRDKMWTDMIAKIKENEEKKQAEEQEKIAKIKEDEEKKQAEAQEKIRAEKAQQAKKARKEGQEAMRARLIEEAHARYLAELAVHARKREETRRYIEAVKKDPESFRNFAVPNPQMVRDDNDDYSEEFKSIVYPEDMYTISYGDKPLPPAKSLKRPKRQIIVE